MLPVNLLEISVSRCERILNQQFDDSRIRHHASAFTRVNARAPYSAQCVNALIDKGFQHPDA
jgi:hypothetical protein